MKAPCARTRCDDPGRQEEHIAIAQQGFGADLIENDLAVDAAGDLEGDARGEIGFDKPGDHFARWPLRGQDEVDAYCSGHLGDARDGCFDVVAGHHHQVGQLIDDADDIGHFGWDFTSKGRFTLC